MKVQCTATRLSLEVASQFALRDCTRGRLTASRAQCSNNGGSCCFSNFYLWKSMVRGRECRVI